MPHQDLVKLILWLRTIRGQGAAVVLQPRLRHIFELYVQDHRRMHLRGRTSLRRRPTSPQRMVQPGGQHSAQEDLRAWTLTPLIRRMLAAQWEQRRNGRRFRRHSHRSHRARILIYCSCRNGHSWVGDRQQDNSFNMRPLLEVYFSALYIQNILKKPRSRPKHELSSPCSSVKLCDE